MEAILIDSHNIRLYGKLMIITQNLLKSGPLKRFHRYGDAHVMAATTLGHQSRKHQVLIDENNEEISFLVAS